MVFYIYSFSAWIDKSHLQAVPLLVLSTIRIKLDFLGGSLTFQVWGALWKGWIDGRRE